MNTQNPDRTPDVDQRTIPARTVQDMLASLQEAVVAPDHDVRRGLLKRVIGQLQEVLGSAAGQ
jgi:hypothetical protein